MPPNDLRDGLVRGTAAAACALLGATALTAPVPDSGPPERAQSYPFALTATYAPTAPSTVLTLEGGLVGLQNVARFTPLQLRGDLCKAPNGCQPVDYTALPSDKNNDDGAVLVTRAIDALPPEQPVILFGHSQGGQVIYAALRQWQNDPASAPDPARATWVSIGNPENPYGGVTSKFGFAQPNPRVPADTPYKGTEVIYQYDGWSDAPDNPFNLLAVLNAVVGSQIYHTTKYFTTDINSPDNVTFTPDQPDGTPGNVTYVYVPADVIPLVSGTGLLAPMLDNLLRPIIERGYNRPVDIPDPTPPKAASSVPTAVPADVPIVPAVKAAAAVTAADPVAVPDVAPAPVVREVVTSAPADEDPSGDPPPAAPVAVAHSAASQPNAAEVPAGVGPVAGHVQSPGGADVPEASSPTETPAAADEPKVDADPPVPPRGHRGQSGSRARTSHSRGGAEQG